LVSLACDKAKDHGYRQGRRGGLGDCSGFGRISSARLTIVSRTSFQLQPAAPLPIRRRRSAHRGSPAGR
jgi:hypothetical protein